MPIKRGKEMEGEKKKVKKEKREKRKRGRNGIRESPREGKF